MAKRDYDNSYPSVTQILGVLRKIGLEMWFKWNTAQFCDEKSKRGIQIGREIHEVIQGYIDTGKAKVETEYDEEVTNALNSFMNFCKDNPDIKPERAEVPLTSELHQFNGTIDCMAGDTLLDWKTGECKEKTEPTIYDEWKYQVAAYVHLYNEVNGTDVQKAVIVAIGKDKVGYATYEMDKQEIDDCFNRVFLPCLSILNYQKAQKQMEKERKKKCPTPTI